jgi:hypothetical protein
MVGEKPILDKKSCLDYQCFLNMIFIIRNEKAVYKYLYHDVIPSILARSSSTSPAAEDGISPKQIQRSTVQAGIDGRTSWWVTHYLAVIIIHIIYILKIKLDNR